MKRTVIQTLIFSRLKDELIRKRKLSQLDFEQFEKRLLEDPHLGDVIPGLAGLRKARLKSTFSGKSGGFRVDYLDIPKGEKMYLVVIYPKNVKEDLSTDEKREIKKLVNLIKAEEDKENG